jgi:hypothetical protein
LNVSFLNRIFVRTGVATSLHKINQHRQAGWNGHFKGCVVILGKLPRAIADSRSSRQPALAGLLIFEFANDWNKPMSVAVPAFRLLTTGAVLLLAAFEA